MLKSLRQQFFVNDKQYLKRMITQHSSLVVIKFWTQQISLKN